jgi:hypothetical protein
MVKQPDPWDVAIAGIKKQVAAAVEADGFLPVRVRYSAYKSDEDGVPVDNLHDVAVEGCVVLVANRNLYFGGRQSKDYESKVLESPTWLQVAVRANEMIGVTRDRSHCFLEGLEKMFMADGVTHYKFLMGS